MNFLDSYRQRLLLQYKLLTVVLLILAGLGMYWQKHPEQVVSESITRAEIISVTPPQHGSGTVGSHLTFATVQLKSGEKAKLSMRSFTPSVGEAIEVTRIEYDNGKVRISANEF